MKKSLLFSVCLSLLSWTLSAQDIFDVVKSGDLQQVKRMVGEDPSLVRALDETRRTPLHWACRGVYPDMVLFLLEFGADADAQDANQICPMHSTASRGNAEATRILLEHGADPNIPDYEEHIPLHYAAMNGHEQVVELLIDGGSNIEALNNRQRTPLILAAREHGGIKVIQVLIEKGANIAARDKYDDDALNLSAWRGYEDIVEYLLEQGAQPDIGGEQGEWMMIYATENALEKLFERLLGDGADVSITFDDGTTLLHQAAEGGSVEILGRLVGLGMDINKEDVFGCSPLHYAAEKGNYDAVAYLATQGALLDARDLQGRTPLNLAAESNHHLTVAQLKDLGASDDPPHFPELKGPYLGQEQPGNTPQLFATGIVSSRLFLHAPPVFSPDGQEAYWPHLIDIPGTGYAGGKIFYSKQIEGSWTRPQPALFNEAFENGEPFFSPDGKRLYFLSERPRLSGEEPGKENIWYIERTKEGWSSPRYLSETVNKYPMHWQFSLDREGNVYFGSGFGEGLGGNDIWVCKMVDGKYQEAENLGAPINSDGFEFCPWISPDGDYLIYTLMHRGRQDSDLMISFRQDDGSWSEPQNLGDRLGLEGGKLGTTISPDGKYLFLLGQVDGIRGAIWVDAGVIQEMRLGASD